MEGESTQASSNNKHNKSTSMKDVKSRLYNKTPSVDQVQRATQKIKSAFSQVILKKVGELSDEEARSKGNAWSQLISPQNVQLPAITSNFFPAKPLTNIEEERPLLEMPEATPATHKKTAQPSALTTFLSSINSMKHQSIQPAFKHKNSLPEVSHTFTHDETPRHTMLKHVQ